MRKMKVLLRFINRCLSPLGLVLQTKTRVSRTQKTVFELSLELSSLRTRELAIQSGLSSNLVSFIVDNFHHSHSQLQQDLIALFLFKDKKGYFCEVGGGDGITYSNSFLLEKMDWQGLIIEPARANQKKIVKSRSCQLSKKAAWSISGLDLKFVETKNLELSTLDDFKNLDDNASDRISVSGEYLVQTTTLTEVLSEFDFPRNFEYLSIDTEGSELEVLKGLDFNQFSPVLITIEHNFTANRKLVREFLSVLGYQQICNTFSRHDDWYLHVDMYVSLKNSQSLIGLVETH